MSLILSGDSYTQTGFDPTGVLPSVGNPLGNPTYPVRPGSRLNYYSCSIVVIGMDRNRGCELDRSSNDGIQSLTCTDLQLRRGLGLSSPHFKL